MTPSANYLMTAAVLFVLGAIGAVTGRSAIRALIGIELMLNAANINLIVFWRYGVGPRGLSGMMFAMFSIGVAAAEAAVGLSLILNCYRWLKTTSLEKVTGMRG